MTSTQENPEERKHRMSHTEEAHNQEKSGEPLYDVAILGTGLGGTMLGAILARHGVNVVLIDRAQHPRFAIGESTIPQTSMMLRILATRFDVPEIAALSGLRDLKSHVASSCGLKRNFGFAYHREGEEHRLDEANQTIIPEFLHGPESHLYRQDTDAWMLMQAVRRGASLRQSFEVESIDFGPSEVTLLGGGESIRARYLVDAAGFRSPVARQLGLREGPDALQTHSRAIFNHMLEVTPFEDCLEGGDHGMPRKWSQGTLHHLFDGGWLWVIPFNNHDDATNPLVSVGLMLDPRRHPANGATPEEEFHSFIGRFPTIARQFKGAKAFRNWVGTGRIQYTSRSTVADRCCLMSHSAGFIDALFSRGLANTTEIVQQLAADLLAALPEDDLSAERFATVDRLQRGLIEVNDRLVSASFTSFRDFGLWNAWHRIWIIGAFLGWLRLTRVHKDWEEKGNADRFADAPGTPGSIAPGLPAFDELFDGAVERIRKVERGEMEAAEATEWIMEQMRTSPVVPPPLILGEEERRHTPEMAHGDLLELYRWIQKTAPPETKEWFRPA